MPRLVTCSRDPIGYRDGWNRYQSPLSLNSTDPWGTTKVSITRSFQGESFCGGFSGTNDLEITIDEPSTSAHYAMVIQRLTIGVGGFKYEKCENCDCCVPQPYQHLVCDVFEVLGVIKLDSEGTAPIMASSKKKMVTDNWGFSFEGGSCGSEGTLNFNGEVRVIQMSYQQQEDW